MALFYFPDRAKQLGFHFTEGEEVMMADAQFFTGRVTELDVGGTGPNSGQLEFALTPLNGGQPEAFAVWMDTEARVFTSMTTILAMAFRASIPVTVEYAQNAGETPKAINVRVPATG